MNIWPFKKHNKPIIPPQDAERQRLVKRLDEEFPMSAEEAFAFDLCDILEIEYINFYPNHWKEKDFRNLFRRGGTICFFRRDVNIIGYTCTVPVKFGVKIESISIHPDYQRKGIATKMLKIMQRQSLSGRGLTAYVSDQNVAAHLFFRSLGFKAMVKRNYYGEGLDAYKFSWIKQPEQGACCGKHETSEGEKI